MKLVERFRATALFGRASDVEGGKQISLAVPDIPQQDGCQVGEIYRHNA